MDKQAIIDVKVKSVELQASFEIDNEIKKMNEQIDYLKPNVDKADYIVAAASGLIAAAIDVIYVGELKLKDERITASEKVDNIVLSVAQKTGYEGDDLKQAVIHLEKKFPLAADGNTAQFGGGLQHHLRDFAHHPTIVGLVFSLLTQFTEKSYGTDTAGNFIIVDVPERSKVFIGETVPEKIFNGSVMWFFHLVSDMAGSSSSIMKSGGTGIPGPILSFAKEVSSLPLFNEMMVTANKEEMGLSVYISKLFNGTIFAERDEQGKLIKDSIVKMDLRGEIGIAQHLAKQTIPVVINEIMVRSFYFIRCFMKEIEVMEVKSIMDLKKIRWKQLYDSEDPTLKRMVTVATAVFTTVDITEAARHNEKFYLSINYPGVVSFAIALDDEMVEFIKVRDVKNIKKMYETIGQNVFREKDNRLFNEMGKKFNFDNFGLTEEQTIILYNIEYLIALNDAKLPEKLKTPFSLSNLKLEWCKEWKSYIESGFSSFIGVPDARMVWYSKYELLGKIIDMNPEKPWFKLVLLEAMIFRPYFTLSLVEDKKGKQKPSPKYNRLNKPVSAFDKQEGIRFLKMMAEDSNVDPSCIDRFEKTYKKSQNEMGEVLKTRLVALGIGAGLAVITVATVGAFSSAIAISLVGSGFTGLTGAALSSACLAYIGGGAVAAGGLGMAGGTAILVGGGAILGLGAGLGAGGVYGKLKLMNKETIILQTAKLMTAIKEIFLNEEHDIEFSNSVYEKYVENLRMVEDELMNKELEFEKYDLKEKAKHPEEYKEIKNIKESVHAMRIAVKEMRRFNSAFETGMKFED